MSTGHPPSVFLGSTCYDLAQIRRDLKLFIESLGMTPVLSEFDSFPVNPDLDTLGNCLVAVRDNADIFILIVGGRHGSPTETGKSITNLEYLQAKAKGIPRYVFVQRQILTTLPIWKNNESGDFSSVVDSPKLFEFVESLRDPKENWIFPFENAQDIIGTLRCQLAYLFADALAIRAKLVGSGLPEALHNLSGAALQLAVQKPSGWEYLLFCQVVSDEVSLCADIKRDLDYGLALGTAVRLRDFSDVLGWARAKISEISSFNLSASRIVNSALPKALGALGEPGDAVEITYTAKQFVRVYRRMLEWTLEFRHVDVEDEYKHVLEIVSRLSQNCIKEIEDFVSISLQQVKDTVKTCEETGERQTLTVTLKLTVPDMSDLDDELNRLASLL